jgi:hypothetical protein
MARICEVCGRVEEVDKEELKYDILDVCLECTEHIIYPSSELK